MSLLTSYLNDTPKNKDFLRPSNFRFFIRSIPHVNYFVTEVNMPGLLLKTIQLPNQTRTLPLSGDHPTYEPLQITFMVDEDMNNWLELHNWISGLGYPLSTDQYKNYKDSKPKFEKKSTGLLYFQTGAKNLNIEVTFHDIHPFTVGNFVMRTADQQAQPVMASAGFNYAYYELRDIRP